MCCRRNKLPIWSTESPDVPFSRSGVVSYFPPLAFVVAGTLRRGGGGDLRCVLLGALVLFLLLFGCFDSCARAQNLGLGGSWLRWLVGVRGVGTAATSRCLGLGRVHLVHAASHRSPPVGYRTERGQECRQRQATLVATFPHSSLFSAPLQLLSGLPRRYPDY